MGACTSLVEYVTAAFRYRYRYQYLLLSLCHIPGARVRMGHLSGLKAYTHYPLLQRRELIFKEVDRALGLELEWGEETLDHGKIALQGSF